MKGKNKFIAIVTVFVMLIMLSGGCGGGGSKQPEKGRIQSQDNGSVNNDNTVQVKAGTGRFFENEITLPGELQNINALKRLEDGSIAVIGSSRNRCRERRYYVNLYYRRYSRRVYPVQKGYFL